MQVDILGRVRQLARRYLTDGEKEEIETKRKPEKNNHDSENRMKTNWDNAIDVIKLRECTINLFQLKLCAFSIFYFFSFEETTSGNLAWSESEAMQNARAFKIIHLEGQQKNWIHYAGDESRITTRNVC